MKRVCGISQLALVSIAVLASSLTFGVAGASAASPTWLCVPKTAGTAVTSGGTGTKAECATETTTVELPPAGELPTLVSILPYIKYEALGIDNQPTLRISGANVQIVNGAGTTATTNGKGNLVIGYNETPGKQTGSHNLILGSRQTFESYGGILAGYLNTISGPWASITGGWGSTASGGESSVTAGFTNKATGLSASVTGGYENTASGRFASVSSGSLNLAGSEFASVTGGFLNKAENNQYATVTGGYNNLALGRLSTIFGGKNLKVHAEWEACGGFPTVLC